MAEQRPAIIFFTAVIHRSEAMIRKREKEKEKKRRKKKGKKQIDTKLADHIRGEERKGARQGLTA